MAMNMKFTLEGDEELRRRLNRAGPLARIRTRLTVMRHGKILQRTVIRRASGRPGPEVETGAYVSRFTTEFTNTGDGYEAEVFNDSPQAARLEYGFAGVDAAGREYHQPPYKHFQPALEEVTEPFLKDIEGIVKEVLW